MNVKRLLNCSLLLLFSACQRPDDVVVGIKGRKGRQYHRTPADAPPLAVLVLRSINYPEFADWLANTRPLTTNNPWLWDQHEQTRALAPSVVAQIDAAYDGRVRIFAAGHSPGGGLAQHAALVCPRIERVFAFNSSLLTGYFDLTANLRRRPSTRRTYLVYESCGVLTLFRAMPLCLNRFAEGADMVVRYNFATGLEVPSPFRQHAMQRLVAGLNGGK